MKTWLAFWFGIFKNNPTFRLVLGLCPTLAVTTSLENALGMGLAASFVLVCSNGLVSALRKAIPAAVHIPCYIVIIATFVTAVDLLMQAYLPALSESLGIFIPLIVVNCVILGRAEAFASRNGVIDSFADGLGSGIGFTLALALVAVNHSGLEIFDWQIFVRTWRCGKNLRVMRASDWLDSEMIATFLRDKLKHLWEFFVVTRGLI